MILWAARLAALRPRTVSSPLFAALLRGLRVDDDDVVVVVVCCSSCGCCGRSSGEEE